MRVNMLFVSRNKIIILVIIVLILTIVIITYSLGKNNNNLTLPPTSNGNTSIDDNVSTGADVSQMVPYSSEHLMYLFNLVKKLPPTYFVGKYESTDCDLFYGGNLSFTVNEDDESLKNINDEAGLTGDLRLIKLSFNIGGPKSGDKIIDQKFGVTLPAHDISHCASAEVKARVKLGDMGLNIKEGPSNAQLLEAEALSAPIYKVTEKVPSP